MSSEHFPEVAQASFPSLESLIPTLPVRARSQFFHEGHWQGGAGWGIILMQGIIGKYPPDAVVVIENQRPQRGGIS